MHNKNFTNRLKRMRAQHKHPNNTRKQREFMPWKTFIWLLGGTRREVPGKHSGVESPQKRRLLLLAGDGESRCSWIWRCNSQQLHANPTNLDLNATRSLKAFSSSFLKHNCKVPIKSKYAVLVQEPEGQEHRTRTKRKALVQQRENTSFHWIIPARFSSFWYSNLAKIASKAKLILTQCCIFLYAEVRECHSVIKTRWEIMKVTRRLTLLLLLRKQSCGWIAFGQRECERVGQYVSWILMHRTWGKWRTVRLTGSGQKETWRRSVSLFLQRKLMWASACLLSRTVSCHELFIVHARDCKKSLSSE